MLLHTLFFLGCLVAFYQWLTVIKAQSLTNPIFWQVPVIFNTSDPLDQGSMVLSESRLAMSQDFQVINTGNDIDYEHERLLINMSSGCNNNTNWTTIQRWNDQLLTSPATQSLPKMALVERGECNWHRKVSVVQHLSSFYHLNIEAMMIYDNTTHGSNASFELQPVNTSQLQQQMPQYNMKLPPNRNITHMKDNDMALGNSSSNSTSNGSDLPVYFTTKDHALYLIQLNLSSSSSSSFGSSATTTPNTSSSHVHRVYQLSPYLSTALLNGNKNDDKQTFSSGFSSMLATTKGYLAYIIALVAVFLIVVILLRWWRLRRTRRQRIAAAAVENGGQGLYGNYILQSRTDRIDPLPVSVVDTLPIVYYSVETISNATCVICLEDYVINKSQARILPCRHGFCVLCIDPWLTQKSSFCPICKYDCLPPDQRYQREQQQQSDRMVPSGRHPITIDMADATIATATSMTTTTSGHDHNQPFPEAAVPNNNNEPCNS